jgi:hypothetical protein
MLPAGKSSGICAANGVIVDGRERVTDTPSPTPPDAAFVRQRWIPARRVSWAQECNQIMAEFGAVSGARPYRARHQARYRAQSLIRLMVELRLHERWELSEHTAQTPQGYTWTVEYVRRHQDASS